MKTVVFQSFRTCDVPRYITECCASVQAWAEANSYTYQFSDDAFLDLVPDWYRRKAGPFVCVITDLARLIKAQQLLMSGVERVVWCDADMLVFRPELLQLQADWTVAYCKEVWLFKEAAGQVIPIYKVNNSMCVFTQAGLDHLAAYIAKCYAVVRQAPSIESQLSVGTDLLSATDHARALIPGVGIVGPVLMEAILDDDQEMVERLREWQGAALGAVNLCNVYRRVFGECPRLYDYLCAGVIERLRSGAAGEVLSRA